MKPAILFLSALCFVSTVFAADTINVTFVGPDSMHIKYHADAHPNPVWLIQRYPTLELIQEVSGSGTYRVDTPAPENYRYELATNGAIWVKLADSFWADYTGNDIYGYMLFDETINRTETLNLNAGVVVPDGITLSLTECPINNSLWVSTDFIVSGTVYVTENVTYTSNSGMKYDIYETQMLSGCQYGNFYFRPDSAGSSIDDAGFLALYAYAPLSLSVVTQSVLNCGDEADITASHCSFNTVMITGCNSSVTFDYSDVYGYCYCTTNASMTIADCRFTYYNPSISLQQNASLTATDCSINTLSINSPGGSCTLSGTTNETVTIYGLSNGEFTDCRFTDSVGIQTAESTSFTCDNCLFFDTVGVLSTAVQFTECDFGNPVSVSSPCAANFQRCQFLHQLGITVNGAGHDMPTVENNSFLYKYAIEVTGDAQYTNETVTIGANYYGDPTGYTYGYTSTTDDMFTKRGGNIDWWPGLDIATPLKKGVNREIDKDMPLRLWEIGGRYGQGTIPHGYIWDSDLTMIKERETLYFVDVGVNRNKTEPIKIRAKYNNQIVYPTRGESIVLQRDYSHLSDIKQEAAYNTLNFILPGVTQDYAWANVQYQPPDSTNYVQVTAKGFYFDDRYDRKLQINIVPVKLHVWGYPGGAPNASDFSKDFVRTMSAKTAIPKDQIRTWYSRRPFHYIGAFGSLSITYLLNDIAAQFTAGKALLDTCSYLSGDDFTIDYTIALFKDGVLKTSGADGASLALFRSIVFTDGDPDATLHEFGHAFGLWRSPEQYDAHPKFGLRVEGVTAFVPEPSTARGFVGLGTKRRIRHFPSSNLYWYTQKNYFDIMGGTPKNAQGDFWPIQDTAKRFFTGYKTKINGSPWHAKNSPPAPGMRRIFVQGKTDVDKADSYLYTYIVPWSLDIMDITEYSGRTEPGPESSDRSDYQYRFDSLDTTGGVIHSETFYSGSDWFMEGGGQFLARGDWYRTFDVPTSSVSYRVTGLYNYNTRRTPGVIWESTAGGDITTAITSPAPGTELDSDVVVEWQSQTTRQANRGIQVPPLRHMVWVSVDGGVTWEAQTFMITENEINLSYNELPATNGIHIRVLSSDGFSTHSTILSDISVAPHNPSVEILTPPENAHGTTGTCWELSADVFDPDSEEIPTVSWSSSLDGALGNGTTVTSCNMSVGTHVLTCTAQKTGGQIQSATRIVHVAEGIDYVLTTNNLWLTSANVGPYAIPCLSIHTGKLLGVSLAYTTPGTHIDTLSAQITMTPPSGTPVTLVTTTWNNIDSFTPLYIDANTLPEEWGTYSFTAELTEMQPADSIPGDTYCTLQYTTIAPPEIAALRDTVKCGYQDETTPPTNVTAYVYNAGGEPLQFGQLSIGGQHANAFSLSADELSMTALAPGETGIVTVTFSPQYVGRNVAYLSLPCNDPRRSRYALNLQGDYITPEPGMLFILCIGILFGIRRTI